MTAADDWTRWPAWRNGELAPADRCSVPALDPGFLVGHAVFTTLAVRGRRPRFLRRHLRRLAFGAAAADLPGAAAESAVAGVAAVAAALPVEDAALRVTLTPGPPRGEPQCLVLARPLEPRPAAVELALFPRPARDRLRDVKHSGRLPLVADRALARGAGAYDALYFDEEGALQSATAANVFVALDGALVTPPVAGGRALAGVAREVLLEHGAALLGRPVREAPVRLPDLARAEELLLTSSLLRALGATAVRGFRADLPGDSGPLARAARAALAEREDAELEPQPSAPGRGAAE